MGLCDSPGDWGYPAPVLIQTRCTEAPICKRTYSSSRSRGGEDLKPRLGLQPLHTLLTKTSGGVFPWEAPGAQRAPPVGPGREALHVQEDTYHTKAMTMVQAGCEPPFQNFPPAGHEEQCLCVQLNVPAHPRREGASAGLVSLPASETWENSLLVFQTARKGSEQGTGVGVDEQGEQAAFLLWTGPQEGRKHNLPGLHIPPLNHQGEKAQVTLGPSPVSSSPGTARLPWGAGPSPLGGAIQAAQESMGRREGHFPPVKGSSAVAGEASQWRLYDGSQSPGTWEVGTFRVPIPLQCTGHHRRPSGACGPYQGRPQGWGLRTSA